MQSEYPKYTPLLANILDGVISRGPDDDKMSHKQEVLEVSDFSYLNYLLCNDFNKSTLI